MWEHRAGHKATRLSEGRTQQLSVPDMNEEDVLGRLWSSRLARGGGWKSGSCEDCKRVRVDREWASNGRLGSRVGLSLCGLL